MDTSIIKHLKIEPAEFYHGQSRANMSSHQLMDFMKTPKLWKKKDMGIVAEPKNDAYMIGEAAHKRILEGRQAYEGEYVWETPINLTTNQPYGPNTKKVSDWKKTQNRKVLTRVQAAEIAEMAAGVRANKDAMELLSSGQPEGVIRGMYEGLNCQIRMDWFNPTNGFVDLKSCRNLSRFEWDAKDFRYDIQMAFYREVLHAVTGIYVPVFIIAVEKIEPYRCGVWQVSPETLTAARKKIEVAIAHFKECKKADNWPTHYEELRTLDIF